MSAPLTSDRGYLAYNGGCFLDDIGRAAVNRECEKLRAERDAERAEKARREVSAALSMAAE